MTRYREWQSGTRQCRDAKRPVLNPNSGCYPTLYKGIAQDRKVRTYNGEDEMTKKTQNASPL
ncbi:hypothetical protein H4N54_00915 [Limnospira fusiformis KN01]|uniref:Uncharacterized protein n=2 Tax=Limnospira TaxID=2596745 RepID=A0A9P1KJI6_9CYAN|nr:MULTISPECIES: hypothetical protein [Limnospira]EKD09256.1 hypothetical protein SPLC1_S206580 [Arthrospira platensis C1]QJB24658.1 hypothetical protein HFV01_01200 [Limnospira fusiformis SAG 85.79]EDZ91758.1 hypothetical protein AmaxDRAFT_5484 [Limnospira maxima CS-328]MDT9287901.1 hypothetical protein [Limnospira sp. PMC 1298.21]QNH60427.1 MAG: hypothetical protein H2674_22760 [Limnospira indica BM01]